MRDRTRAVVVAGLFSLVQTACMGDELEPTGSDDPEEMDSLPDEADEGTEEPDSPSTPTPNPGADLLGELGASCVSDGDCAGGLCITRPDLPSYCSLPCEVGQEDGGYLQCSSGYTGSALAQCTVPIDTTGDSQADAFGCEALCADGEQTWPCPSGQTCQTLSIGDIDYGACMPASGTDGGTQAGGDGGDGGGAGGGGGGIDPAGDGSLVSCSRTANGNFYRVSCDPDATGDVSCECRVNGDLVDICSQSSLTCALPGGTCCDF